MATPSCQAWGNGSQFTAWGGFRVPLCPLLAADQGQVISVVLMPHGRLLWPHLHSEILVALCKHLFNSEKMNLDLHSRASFLPTFIQEHLSFLVSTNLFHKYQSQSGPAHMF